MGDYRGAESARVPTLMLQHLRTTDLWGLKLHLNCSRTQISGHPPHHTLNLSSTPSQGPLTATLSLGHPRDPKNAGERGDPCVDTTSAHTPNIEAQPPRASGCWVSISLGSGPHPGMPMCGAQSALRREVPLCKNRAEASCWTVSSSQDDLQGAGEGPEMGSAGRRCLGPVRRAGSGAHGLVPSWLPHQTP